MCIRDSSPSNPSRRLLPVSSSCIAPCLIAFFFAISFSKFTIRMSMSDSASAMASCSGFGGTGNSIADNCLPFVNALVVYVHPVMIAFRTASVEKQYLQYSDVYKRQIQDLIVKFLSDFTPVWHVPVHNRDEQLVMVFYLQMRQLMQNYILQTIDRFLCQLQIQPNFARLYIASTPARCHVFCLPTIGMCIRDRSIWFRSCSESFTGG